MGGNTRGVLARLPSGVCFEVDDIGILQFLGGSEIDPVASLIAYSRSYKVYWAWFEPD